MEPPGPRKGATTVRRKCRGHVTPKLREEAVNRRSSERETATSDGGGDVQAGGTKPHRSSGPTPPEASRLLGITSWTNKAAWRGDREQEVL
ncbi:hypothetical protein GN956_G6276 [Arapaima gigas]